APSTPAPVQATPQVPPASQPASQQAPSRPAPTVPPSSPTATPGARRSWLAPVFSFLCGMLLIVGIVVASRFVAPSFFKRIVPSPPEKSKPQDAPTPAAELVYFGTTAKGLNAIWVHGAWDPRRQRWLAAPGEGALPGRPPHEELPPDPLSKPPPEGKDWII